MGLLPLLGLDGTSKAVRRLFHRSPPAAENTKPTTTKGKPGRRSIFGRSSQTTQNASAAHDDPDSTLHHLSAPSSSVKSAALPLAMPPQKADGDASPGNNNKENQPPAQHTLTEQLARIKLGDLDTLPAKSKEITPQHVSVSDDPAVQAERERHLHFTEEALAMVRYLSFLLAPHLYAIKCH